MKDKIVKQSTPEERELEKKRAELAALESTLTERELEMATLEAELRIFEVRYFKYVGRRISKLDEINAQINETESRRRPHDDSYRERAAAARSQADDSAREAGGFAARPGMEEDFSPSEELKQLYRAVAKEIHPDLTTDDQERALRHRIMADVNRAYESGDEEQLRAILANWKTRPESIKGETTGAELVRTIRKISQIEERLRGIQISIDKLKHSDIYELWSRAKSEETRGVDILVGLAANLDEKINKANKHLRSLSAQDE